MANQVLDITTHAASLRSDAFPSRSDWIDYLVKVFPDGVLAGALQRLTQRAVLIAPTSTTINFAPTDLPGWPIVLCKDGRIAVLDTPLSAGTLSGGAGTYTIYVDLGVSTVTWLFSLTPHGSESTPYRLAVGRVGWTGTAITAGSLVSYFNSDAKTDILASIPVAVTITGERLNLVTRHDATFPERKVVLTAAALEIQGYRFVGALSATVDLAAAGANGLDTGGETGNTHYYLWAIGKSTDVSPTGFAGVWSLSATAPTMPAGYDLARLVSHRRNDGSSNLIRAVQSNDLVVGDYAAMKIASGITADADGDLTTFVPVAIAEMVWLMAKHNAAAVQWEAVDKDDPTIQYGILNEGGGQGMSLWARQNAAGLVRFDEIAGAVDLDVWVAGWKVKVL